MHKWEYQVIEISSKPRYLGEALDAQGANGWELVGYNPMSFFGGFFLVFFGGGYSRVQAVFKRPLRDS